MVNKRQFIKFLNKGVHEIETIKFWAWNQFQVEDCI